MLKKTWRAIKRLYGKWSYNLRVKNYYSQGKDASSYTLMSKTLNLLFGKALLLAVSFMWFYQRTRNFTASIVLSLIITALISLAFYIKRRKQYLTRKIEKRRSVAEAYLINKMKRLNPDEFRWQIMRLLLKLPGIGSIKSRQDWLESTLHGRKTAVGYYNNEYSDQVPPEELSEFIRSVSLEGFREAIFITTGTFSDQCRDIAARKSMKIHLLDKQNLLELMEKSGMYPDDKLIDSLVNKEISRKHRNYMDFKDEILTPKRIRTYLGYSILFMVLSGIFGSFAVYYTVIAVMFLSLAIIAYFMGMKNTADDKDDTDIIIDEMTAGDPGVRGQNP